MTWNVEHRAARWCEETVCSLLGAFVGVRRQSARSLAPLLAHLAPGGG
jgi:hypothetical protein